MTDKKSEHRTKVDAYSDIETAVLGPADVVPVDPLELLRQDVGSNRVKEPKRPRGTSASRTPLSGQLGRKRTRSQGRSLRPLPPHLIV